MDLRSKLTAGVVALAFACGMAGPASGADYSFNIEYQGAGSASLLVGDDPIGTTIIAGDTFSWNIRAEGAEFWRVVTGGGFFPLMAFGVNESANRIGDFTLELRNNHASVFGLAEIAAPQALVHMGTNTVILPTGLEFDEMHLDYSLTSAIDAPPPNGGGTGLEVGSTPYALLPIFGAPEMNTSSPGIAYITAAIPEPEIYAMLIAGLGLLGIFTRRRRQWRCLSRTTSPVSIT